MTDQELIERLRDPAVFGTQTAVEAADRIEALVRERDYLAKSADEAVKRMVGQRDKAETAEAALKDLIEHTHYCEKELTEKLHHVEFCGESYPLTTARAFLTKHGSQK